MPKKSSDPPKPEEETPAKPKKKVAPKGTYQVFAQPEYIAELERVEDRIETVLKAIMERRGLTAAALGSVMGFHTSSIRKRVRKETKFGFAELVALANWLDVDPSVFYDPDAPVEQILRRGARARADPTKRPAPEG